MLQPAMLSRFIIIILLFSIGIPCVAEAARLTLGASPGVAGVLDAESQARRLAAALTNALGDEVEVRLFDDQQQLGRWLNQFAMVDLGLVDSAFLAEHPGEFLVLGPSDQTGRLYVVARQGATGDMPQKIASVLSRGDSASPLPPPPRVKPSVSTAPSPAPAIVDSAAPLVLGMVTGRDELLENPGQADQFAGLLGKRLGVPVQLRLFDDEQRLAEWFLRFRMVDLAVIGEPGRRDPLIGDYRPLTRLTAVTGKAGLLVVRQDLSENRLQSIEQALAAFGSDQRLVELSASLLAVPPAVAARPEPAPVPVTPIPPPPVWPELPSIPSAPEEPEMVPVVPPMPPVSQELAEAPAPPLPDTDGTGSSSLTSPTTAEAVVPMEPAETDLPEAAVLIEPDEEPSAAQPLPSLGKVEDFQLPKSIGPVGVVAEEQEQRPVADDALSSILLPGSAAPVESELLPAVEPDRSAAVVAEAPVPEVPVAPAPVPADTVAAETVPETLPELPFVPVPPRESEDASESAIIPEVVVPPLDPAPVIVAEPSAAAVAEAPVPEVPVAPAPVPADAVAAEIVSETPPELPFVPVPPREIAEEAPSVASHGSAEDVEPSSMLLGANEVPAVISQPDLPQELRPPGIPLPRPGRLPKETLPADEPLLLAKLEEPLARTPKAPPLLPEREPEPGVVYIAPFITLMVPPEVQERVFDQFVDTLNQRGAARQLKFVILKQGIDKIDRAWLSARKHALGEIYGYVEDSGCCSTDLRTRVRLTYYRPREASPALKFEYPIRIFFDHDQSTLAVERQKLADQIAAALVDELLKALQP